MNNSCKYIFDIIFILLISPILIVLFIFISVGILITMGKPIFFLQIRTGKNEKEFKIIKFRTMLNNNMNDEKRLTIFGNFLRKHSLDEISEIINVIKGDMSIVGPRPLYKEYNKLYNDYQKQRMKIKPGITGLAQINGRNNISWEEKFDHDVWYVNNSSFFLDFKIICISFFRVFFDKNIYSKENKFTEKFKGTKKKF